MKKSPSQIVQYFTVVGLGKDPQSFNREGADKPMLVNLELIQLPKDTKGIILIDTELERFIDLDGTKQLYLKCIYQNIGEPKTDPITEINFYRIRNYQGKKSMLIKPETDLIEPVPIGEYPKAPECKRDKATAGREKKKIILYKGNYDLTEILAADIQPDNCLCLCFKKEKNKRSIFEVLVKIPTENNVLKIPSYQKGIPFRMGKSKNRFLCYSHRRLEDVRFESEILDRYPRMDRPELLFPTTHKMFCFPEGIQLCTESDTTTPIFFSFVLTMEDGQRLYGACLTIYEPVTSELGASLSKMLECPKLLMPKALCIISKYSFVSQFKEILKQVYRLHISQSHIPIERYICNLVDEIPIPRRGMLVQYEIGSSLVNFYRPLDQIPPYASNEDFEFLFRNLSIENIIDVITALMLERKVALLSSRKALLWHCAFSLVNLLYPFSWPHVFIPILPVSLSSVLEAPFPFIIGISEEFSNIPLEVMRVNLDNNKEMEG